MLRLNSEIILSGYRFTSFVSIEINSGWDNLTDTARILLPTTFADTDIRIDKVVKVGSFITISLGYFPALTSLFLGYVTKVTPDNPVAVECEDTMWTLKQETIENYSKNGVTLTQLNNDLSLNASLDVKVNLGKIRAKNVNKAEFLSKIKDNYGLFSFYRGEQLKIGLPYSASGNTYAFYLNGANANVIESGLTYSEKDSKKVVVKAVNFLSNSETLEIYAYWKNNEVSFSSSKIEGDQRTLFFYGSTLSDMKESLKLKLPQLNYGGYTGEFTTFLEPTIKHGDRVQIYDYKYPERQGTYLVKRVSTNFGIEIGGRQEIELDVKVA